MRVRISQPGLLPDLLEFLRLRPDVVAQQLGEGELELSLLGSHRADALRMELELHLRAWQASHPGVELEVLEDGGRPRKRRRRLRLV